MVTHLEMHSESIAHLKFAQPECCDPDLTLGDVLDQMQKGRRGSMTICENNKVVGIVTERDLVRLMAAGTRMDVPISQVMTRSPCTIRHNQTIGEAIELMSRGGYRRLPVIDEHGAPVGTLKVSHILRYLVEHFPAIVYNLPPKPHLKTHEREGA
jgi:CBS domain-containing protein